MLGILYIRTFLTEIYTVVLTVQTCKRSATLLYIQYVYEDIWVPIVGTDLNHRQEPDNEESGVLYLLLSESSGVLGHYPHVSSFI